MKRKEIVKFIAETLRNVGVGFIISSVVLFLSDNIKVSNSVLLFLLGIYTILSSFHLFVVYEEGGEK